jgi:hypothetical protein
MMLKDAMEFLLVAISVLTVAVSVYTVISLVMALRAKHRTHWLLANEAIRDRELQLLIERAAKDGLISGDDLEHAIRLIEKKTAALSPADRKFVHEGLTQHNRVGAQRYCVEMLTGA